MAAFPHRLAMTESLCFYVDPHVHTSVWYKGLHDGGGWYIIMQCEAANFSLCVRHDHGVFRETLDGM